MKRTRTVKQFEVEVYTDEKGKIRYSGNVIHMNTREPVTLYYKTKKSSYYHRINRGMNFATLKSILYQCDYYIQGIGVYITRDRTVTA